jgi:hypothetical protein
MGIDVVVIISFVVAVPQYPPYHSVLQHSAEIYYSGIKLIVRRHHATVRRFATAKFIVVVAWLCCGMASKSDALLPDTQCFTTMLWYCMLNGGGEGYYLFGSLES